MSPEADRRKDAYRMPSIHPPLLLLTALLTLAAAPPGFQEYMAHLKDEGYQVIPLREIAPYTRARQGAPQEEQAVLEQERNPHAPQ